MTDPKNSRPQTISDDDLDGAVGGINLGETVGGRLKANIASFSYDEDGNLASKVLIADAAGGGNTTGGGAPKGGYTFDEVIDGEFVPVTYKLNY